MFLFKVFIVIVVLLSLWTAFSPAEMHNESDDHLGMRVGTDHVGPSLFFAVVGILTLIVLD